MTWLIIIKLILELLAHFALPHSEMADVAQYVHGHLGNDLQGVTEGRVRQVFDQWREMRGL